ncbi:MAG: DEAD/DEAH box helicase [Myxococcota bacterium]
MPGPPPALPFCPPVTRWFQRRFAEPTDAQRRGWPAIACGSDTLIFAPTGSGKTLAAFLVVVDRLVRRALAGALTDEIEAVYVSPLRALSHDIHHNLEVPLSEIRQEARALGLSLPPIRAALRTGDTTPAARQALLRRAPHLLVTTPESLYLLLTAGRSRELLRVVRTVIVDEIHALARDKRGSHLALSLERLDALQKERPQRIGLSATQRPVEGLARFLTGGALCEIVDLGHQRDLDLAVDVPEGEDLQAVAPSEHWDELLDRLADQIRAHRTTLVFANTRRLAERVAHRLSERLPPVVAGEDAPVVAHHGSLARERRLAIEARLREGTLRALVATGSLELGIDIGSVDLVVQLGSPRSIASFLQRVGRSGHALGRVPCGRLVPTTRDELVESAALVRAAYAGRLDAIEPPRAPLDILAQQIVAACSCEEWDEDALFALVRRADPYRGLTRRDYDAVLEMLSRGFETPRGRRGTYLHRDRIGRRLRARRGARIAALTSGGAIPESGDYRVVLDPRETFIGTVNEDWAIESMAGDVFLLGSHSWRIRRIESGVVRVVDAQGAPPTLPFWLGEAPARSSELCREISALREEIARALLEDRGGIETWLKGECRLSEVGAEQLCRYIRSQLDAVGRVPTCSDLLAERFFDEAGGTQLVIHSPHGARINRGLALALRKRFCQSFNQELQAAATDDALVLSLGSAQSFPLESLTRFLSSSTIEDVLAQAMLGAPLFATRWRWNANRSLAVLRMRSGRRVPFPLQRMQADDLLAAAFPDQVACQENVRYPIEIPDHPLVRQTLHDCLHEAADLEGLRGLLRELEEGSIRLHVIETVEPSPFCHEILNARPYAFLDDAPLEERRTRAVVLRHVLPEHAKDLARLEPEAIERVCAEVVPVVRDPDELIELLLDVIVLRERDLPDGTRDLVASLRAEGRAARATDVSGVAFVFAAERLRWVEALLPAATLEPPIELPASLDEGSIAYDSAFEQALRAHIALLGPVTPEALAHRLGASVAALETPLAALESRGVLLRGRFHPAQPSTQICDRGLLARIHRYTLARLRREIEPVSARDFLRFLLRWQHLEPETHLVGEDGVARVIEQLAGYEAPVAVWEGELLASRVLGYQPALLDALCLNGRVGWARLRGAGETHTPPSRATPIALFPRSQMHELLGEVGPAEEPDSGRLRAPARRVRDLLHERGALFAGDLPALAGLLPVQVDEALKELVAVGLASCDGFAPLRRLLLGARRRSARRSSRRSGGAASAPGPEGRWVLLARPERLLDLDAACEAAAWRLLRRYGVVFRTLLLRERGPWSWRDLHRAFRKLEAQGQVRGGRFVSGFTGEQFALPEAIPLLRRVRKLETDERELWVSATDPLNLVGVLTPGPRLPASPSRGVIYQGGLPVAILEAGRRQPLPGAQLRRRWA